MRLPLRSAASLILLHGRIRPRVRLAASDASAPVNVSTSGSRFPLSEDELAKRASSASVVAWGFAAGSLGALWATSSSPQLQGAVAACGAIFTFGASSLPAKHPAAAAAGPLLFQLWVTVGNALLNLLLLILLRVELQWSGWGVLGAAALTATQLFAWPAIQSLGAAAGPGIWCGVGMLTSFLWGVAVFGERLRSPILGAAAVGMLVAGVAGVAASQSIAARKDAQDPAPAANEMQPAKAPAPNAAEAASAADAGGGQSWLASGVACALATGVCDGSLMAPFSAFRAGQADAAGSAVALLYLGGFALALPAVALVPIGLALALRHARSKERHGGSVPPAPPFTAAALPGVCCGGLWAAGNVLSVHATMRLGQAVGFPLTQVCVLVSALWGILYFGELRDRRALTLFGASSMVVITGAAALKLAGGGA